MSSSPLNGWLPGVLSDTQVATLRDSGWIEGLAANSEIGASAVDLTLSDECYKMINGSIKPFGESYAHFVLNNQRLAQRLKPDSGDTFTLQKQHTFVFRLKEELGTALRNERKLYGQATAKSSVGRVDVLARLIVDGMDSYEFFNPCGAHNGSGKMFLEITPITFNVRVKPGCSLTQLRLFYGDPHDCEIRGKELYGSVLIGGLQDGCLSVDLTNTKIHGKSGCAFRAKPNDTPVALWEDKSALQDLPDPKQYWDLLESTDLESKGCFSIEKEHFYILRSKEEISLPPGVAVYCRAIDETIGEMRIHYAGFVHPRFGYQRDDGAQGTPLIFEVRGHDVSVTLTDGEKMARLTFYRLSADSTPKKSPYDKQVLQLSKFFGEWKWNCE
jgi:dCTP deaminase